jgi:1-acyl-sn-glycerol-3-phosphate acyltransferase
MAEPGGPTLRQRVAGSWQLNGLQRIAYLFVRTIGQVQVRGGEDLPGNGPLLLAMNHRSMLDGPLICGVTPRPVSCLVKAEAFGPGVGWLLSRSGQIAVVRDTVDPAPVRRCVEILRAGGVVGIFPEGTRGDGAVRTAKPGVGYLALRSGATVVPVACHGTAALGRSWRRAPVLVVLGSPMAFTRHPDGRCLNRRRTAEANELIRIALAGLVATTSPGLPATIGRLAA